MACRQTVNLMWSHITSPFTAFQPPLIDRMVLWDRTNGRTTALLIPLRRRALAAAWYLLAPSSSFGSRSHYSGRQCRLRRHAQFSHPSPSLFRLPSSVPLIKRCSHSLTRPNNRICLMCVVDGESTAFPAVIESTQTVAELKNVIKADRSIRFADIDAAELELWKISVAAADVNVDLPCLVDSIDHKQELDPTHQLSDVFTDTLPKKTIHILVRGPPQQVRNIPTGWKSIPDDEIESEISYLLNSVTYNHPTPSQIAQKAIRAKATQTERLGWFYKTALPYHEDTTGISLVMLPLKLDQQATTKDGNTLRSIVQGDIERSNNQRVVAVLGPSGSGKTATVVDLARTHFVIYSVCSAPSLINPPGFQDSNFLQLATDVETIYRKIVGRRKPGPLATPQNIDLSVKAYVEDRVQVEFLARLLFLQLLLENNPDLKPWDFFLAQTTKGELTIGVLVERLLKYHNSTIVMMRKKVHAKLQTVLIPREIGLVIALDEAQVAANSILTDKLISPSALDIHKDNIFDDKNQVWSQFRRGFLTPLVATLNNMFQATLVILGTSLSLEDLDHVYTSTAKQTDLELISRFYHCTKAGVDEKLSGLIDLSGCEIPDDTRAKLVGRARFSIDVVKTLFFDYHAYTSKQDALNAAIANSIEHTKKGLRYEVRKIISKDRTGGATQVLGRMVLDYRSHDGNISFLTDEEANFVNTVLCRLQTGPHGIRQVVDEIMVVEAVEEELERSGMDPLFREYNALFNRTVTNLGAATSAKGVLLESLIRQSLQRFNGFRLADLPFLRGMKLPRWCEKVKFQIDEIDTATGLGYTSDVDFLSDRPSNKLLVPSNTTRPDGLWFFSDNRYAGSLAIKLYGRLISQKTKEENESSSDIRSSFLQKDGVNPNPSVARARKAFVASRGPSSLKGILRIHVVFPKVISGKDDMLINYVKKNPKTGSQDVMVYIRSSNMDDLLDGGIEENQNVVKYLRGFIRGMF